MTGNRYSGFFPKMILGSEVIEEDIFEAQRQQVRDLGGRAIGEAVFDDANFGLQVAVDSASINLRRCTVTGNMDCMADSGELFANVGSDSTDVIWSDGSRAIKLHDNAWFTNLPFENANGSTYYVFLHKTRFPIDVGIGQDGSRGYNRWVDAPGISVNPTSVSVVSSTSLRLVFDKTTSAIFATYGIQPWLCTHSSSSYQYKCTVYLDTDVSGVEIQSDDPDTAIAFEANLRLNSSGHWQIDLTDNLLGQSAASTTAAHYRVAVLGPIITDTDFSSNEDYVFLGQIDSATGGDTVDTSDQIVVRRIGSAIDYFDTFNDNLFVDGVISRPTTSVTGGGGIVVSADGSALVNGVVADIPAATIALDDVTSTVYLYYDVATDSVTKTTTASDAMSTGRVPFYRFDVAASPTDISNKMEIGRRWRKFTGVLPLTVATSTSLGAQFPSVKEALAFAVAVSAAGAQLTNVDITLVGDVTEPAAIDTATLQNLKNVTIRGATRVIESNGSGSLAIAGSRWRWSFTTSSLIELKAGAILSNWRFENVVFQPTGSYTNTALAIIGIQSGVNATINGLEIAGCCVDGSNAMNADSGGGVSGAVPHLLAMQGTGTHRGIVIRDCLLSTEYATVYHSSSGPCSHLSFMNNKVYGDTAIATDSTSGMVVSVASGSPVVQHWRIEGNHAEGLTGPAVKVTGSCKYVQIRRNFLSVYTANSVVEFSGGTTYTLGVFVTDNFLEQTASTTEPILEIRKYDEDPGSETGACIVHDNVVYRPTSDTGTKGIVISDASDNGRSGVLLHSNVVTNCETGITATDVYNSIVAHNIITDTGSDGAGIMITDVNSGGVIVAGNVVEAKNGISLADADSCIIAMNHVRSAGTDGGGAMIDVGNAEGAVVALNLMSLDSAQTNPQSTIKADTTSANCLFVGNLHFYDGVTGANQVFTMNGSDHLIVGEYYHKVRLVSAASGNMYAGVRQEATNSDGSWFSTSTGDVISGSWIKGRADFTEEVFILGSRIDGDNPSIHTDAPLWLMSSHVADNVMTDGTSGIDVYVAGTYIGGLIECDSTSGELRMMGSYVVETITSAVTTGKNLITGCWAAGIDDVSGLTGGVYSGNYISGNVTLEGENLSVTGNYFGGTLTLAAAFGNGTFVGNRVVGTFTDSSTSSTVASNES